jgi:hypothetical protein
MQIGTYSASGGRTEPARDHEARQPVSPSLRLGVSHTGRDSTSLGTLRGPVTSTGRSPSESVRRTPDRGRAVVLVEGISDKVALEALAERRSHNLAAEGISIVPIGGAQGIGRSLDRFGPRGLDVRLAGLCDAAEEGDFRRGLERAGLGDHLTRSDMEDLGFFVCVEDLEDELIRSLGATAVEQVVEVQGDLRSFRTLQKQPAWRGQPLEEQLRRFMGSGGSRKIRYARSLVDALDLTRAPRPLDRVLAHAVGRS